MNIIRPTKAVTLREDKKIYLPGCSPDADNPVGQASRGESCFVLSERENPSPDTLDLEDVVLVRDVDRNGAIDYGDVQRSTEEIQDLLDKSGAGGVSAAELAGQGYFPMVYTTEFDDKQTGFTTIPQDDAQGISWPHVVKTVTNGHVKISATQETLEEIVRNPDGSYSAVVDSEPFTGEPGGGSPSAETMKPSGDSSPQVINSAFTGDRASA